MLRGAWQGKTYEQMVETCKYSLTYLKQAAGPKLWKLLSEALGEDVSKTNFRAVLERQWRFSFGDASRSHLGSQAAEFLCAVRRTGVEVLRPQEFTQPF